MAAQSGTTYRFDEALLQNRDRGPYRGSRKSTYLQAIRLPASSTWCPSARYSLAIKGSDAASPTRSSPTLLVDEPPGDLLHLVARHVANRIVGRLPGLHLPRRSAGDRGAEGEPRHLVRRPPDLTSNTGEPVADTEPSRQPRQARPAP